jgi:ABC-type transporter Mla subunit MlaD
MSRILEYIVLGIGAFVCVLFCIGMEKLFEFMFAGSKKVADVEKRADNAEGR